MGVTAHHAANEEDELDAWSLAETGVYLGGSIYIWNRARIVAAAGPYGATYAISAAVGVGISTVLFGEQGLRDSSQFYVGLGNYWSGDPNESGYFNIPTNVMTIIEKYESPFEESLPSRYRPGYGGRLA